VIPDADSSDDTPGWLPSWAPSKRTLDYLAVTGTILALGALVLLATGVIRGGHLRALGLSGIGGAGT
jgi:hypothetical protein